MPMCGERVGRLRGLLAKLAGQGERLLLVAPVQVFLVFVDARLQSIHVRAQMKILLSKLLQV